MRIGIDAGGTLIKIASRNNGQLSLRKYPVGEMGKAAGWVNAQGEAEVCVTGGKAALLQSLLARRAAELVEFEATRRGVAYLLGRLGMETGGCIVTNVGTGTSIHYMRGGTQERLGGTGIGGGTLMGLSRLLTGLTDYDEIVRLAALGRRDRIDLTVARIYEGAEPPIPGDLTASNFGSVLQAAGAYATEELLAAVVGLVGETAATASVLAANRFGLSRVVYVGSSFIRNDLLREVAGRYTELRGAAPVFPEDGEYSGAIGALLFQEEQA